MSFDERQQDIAPMAVPGNVPR